jgi:xanthine dehydrogenase YagR molybdenum-binding subunit
VRATNHPQTRSKAFRSRCGTSQKLTRGAELFGWSKRNAAPRTTRDGRHLADELGLPFDKVRFEYGDSRFPDAPVAGGSNSTISVAAAVKAACDKAKKTMHGLVGEDEQSPLMGTRFDGVEFRDGGIYHKEDETRGESFAAILARFEMGKIEAEGEAAPDEDSQKYSMGSYGAQFCEVRVDEDTGEVCVSRFLGVFDCGKIINPKTASS